MAGLFDGIEEISFKAVEGGYIFETPPPWVFGPVRAYFVTEVQKAAIAASIRQTLQRMKPFVIAGWIGLILAYFAMIFWLTAHDYTNPILFFASTLGISVPYVWLIHAYRAWQLQPVIAGLPRTDMRIGIQGRARLLGTNASFKFLLLGLISSALGFFGMVQALLADHPGGQVIMDLFSFAATGLLTAYFGYLIFIRKMTGKTPN